VQHVLVVQVAHRSSNLTCTGQDGAHVWRWRCEAT
jgi:hypothetical protein